MVDSANSNTSVMENPVVPSISTLDNLTTNSAAPNVGSGKKNGIMWPSPHSTTAW